MQPLFDLHNALGSFVEQTDHFALLLTTYDDEIPLITQTLDALDETSPSDIFFVETRAVDSLDAYVDAVVRSVGAQLASVNAEREEEQLPYLAPVPRACLQSGEDPPSRLRLLFSHMSGWLAGSDDHRLVVALLPTEISDRGAHAKILGSLLSLGGQEPWMRCVRLIARDDASAPFVVDALSQNRTRSVALYTPGVTIDALADAVAADAVDPDLPPVQRTHALLQCAAMDAALGRGEAAIQKYGILFQYYDEHRVPQMKALVVSGVGDVLARAGRLPAARDKYLQALDLASDATSLPMILNVATSIGEVDMKLSAYGEADVSFSLAATTAEKLANGFSRADALEKAGFARAASGQWARAVEAWVQAANVARESDYDARLASVLRSLVDVSGRGGFDDVRARYDSELREVEARLARA